MSEVSERAASRLDNLKNIEPLLSSLRVLSLSTMQMASRRKINLQAYKTEYRHILSQVVPLLSGADQDKLLPVKSSRSTKILVVLGSDRGICGPYNRNLAEKLSEWLSKHADDYSVISFGSRLASALKQTGVKFQGLDALSRGSLPNFAKAYQLMREWLSKYQTGELERVEVLSHIKIPGLPYQPTFSTLIPAANLSNIDALADDIWPSPIIEGDPLQIVLQAIDDITAINFYDLIIESIIAENTIRYSLLEEAKENTQDLIDELTLEVQMARRQAITQQIQELAVSAGLTS